jgi:Zinc carboxypeptidase
MVAPLFLALALQIGGPFTQTLSPGTTYDPSIPTLSEIAGHDFDQEVTAPPLVNAYMYALANASDRALAIEYGRTWEGRPLVAIVIGSAERIARLEEIKADLQRLANPDLLADGELERLIAELPVVTALVHGIHGNEISSSGAGMAEAYHLLAAENDPRVELILRESLVLIDPMQNADGRARFVLSTVQGRAAWPDDNPLSAEHDEPWPGGRTNHYLFDLNRDWFAQTQPESRGRVAMLLGFQPHITVDLHEMGGNSTYYFPPSAIPGNTHVTADQNRWYREFGVNNADEFDERGFAYFTRDVFDAFYPGYGASWPTTHGSLGMTFEQASARGLRLARNDGGTLTYGTGVLQHWTAAMRTAQTAAANREALLRDFASFRQSAIDMADTGTREYILHSAHDPALAERLAMTLVANGIRVGRTTEPVTVDGRTLVAGSAYVVPAGQPAGRLVRNLLDATTPLPADFVQRQIERRAQRLPDQIYDVTAWSMPLLWDVESIEVKRATGVATTPVAPLGALETMIAPDPLPTARVGYLIPWNSAGAAAVTEALAEGIKVRAAGRAFTLGGRDYGVGTAIIRVSDNGADLGEQLAPIVWRHHTEAVAVNESFVDSGMSLGANQVMALQEPRVLLAWDRPGRSNSAGWARFILERRYGTAVTAVRARSLGRVSLSDFDVIILPDGNYGSVFDDAGVERLRRWMSEGGTLITMANSSAWASRAGLLATGLEGRGGGPAGSDGGKATQDQPIDYLEAIAPATEAPEQTPGAILNVDLDTGHWLAAGTDGRVGALVSGTRIFSPITLDRGTNVGIYAPPEDLVAGGIVWEEARPQLPYKAFVIHQPTGRGQLVAFAEDPNYRAYAEATSLLFFNAVMLGSGR